MRPILWKWVGVGALVALGVAWLAEVWLTTSSPFPPWQGVRPSSVVSAIRVEKPHASTRPAPPGPPGLRGGTVIVVHPDGSAEQVTVGMGQTVVVDSDGSVHMVMAGKAGQAAWKNGPGDSVSASAAMRKAEAVSTANAAEISKADAVAASGKLPRHVEQVGDNSWTPGTKVIIGDKGKPGVTAQPQPAVPIDGESN